MARELGRLPDLPWLVKACASSRSPSSRRQSGGARRARTPTRSREGQRSRPRRLRVHAGERPPPSRCPPRSQAASLRCSRALEGARSRHQARRRVHSPAREARAPRMRDAGLAGAPQSRRRCRAAAHRGDRTRLSTSTTSLQLGLMLPIPSLTPAACGSAPANTSRAVALRPKTERSSRA